MKNEPKDHPNEILLPIISVINGTFLLNPFIVTYLSLECMSPRFYPANHLPNISTTTSTICDRPEGCPSPRDRTKVQEIVTTAALLVNLSSTTQQHRPDSTLSFVSGYGGVHVACGTGAMTSTNSLNGMIRMIA